MLEKLNDSRCSLLDDCLQLKQNVSTLTVSVNILRYPSSFQTSSPPLPALIFRILRESIEDLM
jgi:hypothetical protein